MTAMQRNTPIGQERLVSYLLHKKPECVQAALFENSDGTQSWRVTLTDPTYQHSPLVCPTTFAGEDFTEHEVLYHELVESWLKRVTGYQKTIIWSLR